MPGLLDEPRADDAAICPFLRLVRAGALESPRSKPDDANTCTAAGDPRAQSIRQQELLCLHASHADCPRYLLATSAPLVDEAGAGRGTGWLQRATVAALLILMLSAGVSFGFVLRRGGFDLSGSAAPAPTTAAVVETGAPGGNPSPTTADGSSGAGASEAPIDTPSASPSLIPSPSPSSLPSPTAVPTATPVSSPTASPAPGPTPSASRLKLLTACPGQSGCYIYKVKSGDNLYGIAQFFGVKLSAIYAMNPSVNPSALHSGTAIKIPTPTR